MEIYFSQYWRLESPITKYRQIRYLVRAAFWLIDDTFQLCPHLVKKTKELPGVSFMRGLISRMRVCLHCLITFQKAPPPNSFIGVRISMYAFHGNTGIQIITPGMYILCLKQKHSQIIPRDSQRILVMEFSEWKYLGDQLS